MTKPVLWHIPVSHFSEKARWALAWKGVEHERRAPLPGAHIPIALWLTRGAQMTFPVLRLDERNIGDSTAIIAALEQRWPDPPLYPEDPQARAHALELEEFFDERLGPQIRLLAWHELRTDREQMATLSRTMLPGPMRDFGPAVAAGGAFGSAYVQLRFRVASDEAAALAGDQVLAAFERLESELDRGDGEFLVGDAFSVADLTAASLFYPIVNPPEGPSVFGDAPPRLEEFFAPLRERPGGQWIADDVPPLPRAGDLDDGLDLDRDVERQLTGADRRARVSPGLRTPDLEHEVGEPVDHGRRLVEPRCALHEAERLDPSAHAVEVAEDDGERREDRQPGEAGRLVALLDVELISDATGHQHLVAVDGQMAGDVGVLAAHLDQVERELDPRRGRERLRELELELGEPVGNPSHLPGSLALAA